MSEPERQTSKVLVPSDDPERNKEEEEKKEHDLKKNAAKDETKPEDADGDLSPEDKALKTRLELLVQIVLEGAHTDEQAALQKKALDDLHFEIRSATSSMSSVPLPLKFLQPHYDSFKKAYAETKRGENKLYVADILSVMAMSMGKSGARESLRYRLEGTTGDVGAWGHEYVRNLAGEVGNEWEQRKEHEDQVADLERLVDQIIPFNAKHHAEVDAFDLLLQIGQLEKIIPHITSDNIQRVAGYAVASSDYVPDPDVRMLILEIIYGAYLKLNLSCDALRVAIKMGGCSQDKERIIKCFENTEDVLVKKQMGYILAAQRIVVSDFEGDDELMEIIGNVQLNKNFLNLAKELGVEAPKAPEDIFKSHLDGIRTTANVDSARQNLASTFVNAFVNAGFGKDTLVTPENSDWLYKNKTHGMMSAAASLGTIMLWDVDTGFSAVDKYSFSAQSFIKAGALLATGIVSSGVLSELDAAYALLAEHVESENVDIKTGAIMGLGLAYAGSAREDVLETLVPLLYSQPMEIVSLACLALGLVFVGTANDNIAGSIVEAFLDRSDTDLKDSIARQMCLGLGLLFLGKGEASAAAQAAIQVIEHPIGKYLEMVITTCAFVGSADVEEIQKLVAILSEHIKEDPTEVKPAEGEGKEAKDAKEPPKDATKEAKVDPAKTKDSFKAKAQEVALLGIAMIASGEEVASQMALRALDHTLQYGELNVRRAIPLALSFLSISNPQLTVMDTLSKLTHDQDQQVSQNSILALGFLGAGTNNSRISGILRTLAVFYAKEPNHLFLVRIAQGLLHMGKGLVSLNPYHSDNLLMSQRHFLLFSLVCSMRLRVLVCLDEDGNFVPVSVRVGQAVDVVGQAGKPKSITGFQTHKTPVLLGAGERAEFSTDEYIALTSVLEGFVIVRKNPDSVDVLAEK